MTKLHIATIIFALVVIPVQQARAVPQTAKQIAQREYVDGKKLYDVGEYQRALEAFKRAYLAYEEPTFLFNMAQCYRQLGNKQEAINRYRSYLRNTPDAPNRDEVNRIVADLETAVRHEREAAAERERASQAPPQGTLPPTRESPRAAEVVAQPQAAPAEHHKRRTWIWGVVGGVAAAGLAVGLGVGLTVGRPAETSLMKVTF